RAQIQGRGAVGVAADEPFALGVVDHGRLLAVDDGLVHLAKGVPGEGRLLAGNGAGDELAGVVVAIGVSAAGPADGGDGVGPNGGGTSERVSVGGGSPAFRDTGQVADRIVSERLAVGVNPLIVGGGRAGGCGRGVSGGEPGQPVVAEAFRLAGAGGAGGDSVQ